MKSSAELFGAMIVVPDVNLLSVFLCRWSWCAWEMSSNEYKSQYVPPSSVTVPWYMPGQTQTTFINNYSNFSGYVGNDYFHGTGSGWGTASTTSPGYFVPMTVTRPGYHVGAYYPYLCVSALDTSLKKLAWSGSVTVSTSEPDIRKSAQVILSDLFGREELNFPLARDATKLRPPNYGVIGCYVRVFTPDGNNFYPIITGIFIDSPVHKKGLRLFDIITHIDGKSNLNLPTSKIMDAFNNKKYESVVLTIKRDKKIFDVTLIAEDEAWARANWRKMIIIDAKGKKRKVKVPQD